MMAPGHLLSGAVAGVALAPLIPGPPAVLPTFVGIATVAALGPDLDTPGSRLSRSLGPVTWLLSHVLAFLSRVTYAATQTALDRDNESGHRGLTHTLAFSLLVGAGGALGTLAAGQPAWAPCVGLGLLTGWLAHLAGDALTIYGVPFWWPLPIGGRRWHCVGAPMALRFRTGGKSSRHADWAWVNVGERVVTFLLLLTFVGLSGATLIGGGSWLTALN